MPRPAALGLSAAYDFEYERNVAEQPVHVGVHRSTDGVESHVRERRTKVRLGLSCRSRNWSSPTTRSETGSCS